MSGSASTDKDTAVEMEMNSSDSSSQIPSEAIGTRALPGFIGKSAKSGYVRLHRLRDINEYIDIKKEDIVLTREVKSSQVGSIRCDHTLVWVNPTTVVDYTSVESFMRSSRSALLRGHFVRVCFEGTAPTAIPTQGQDFPLTAGSSGEQSNTTLDCWHCCSTYISGC